MHSGVLMRMLEGGWSTLLLVFTGTWYWLVCVVWQGHYLKMQRFLHEQPGSQKSYDIITQCCALFEVIVRHIRPTVLPVAVKGWCRLPCS